MTEQELRKIVARLSRAAQLIDSVAVELAGHIGADKELRQRDVLVGDPKSRRQRDDLK